MTALDVLFIGGTGVISAASSQLAVELGIDLHVLNRGRSAHRPLPDGARLCTADVRDPAAMRAAVGDRDFDAVVNFVAFTPEQVQADLDLSFPITIVRPSHTYDRTSVPYDTGWTMIERMRRGKPVVVHGDGTSLWTLTHTDDFAKGFVGLLGSAQAIGESFHITSDEVLTWNQIHELLAAAAGAEARIVHVTSEAILAADETWGRSLLGDKAHSMVFDNSKLRRVVPGYVATIPFSHGAREIVAWHDADPARRRVDPGIDALLDRLAGE